MQFDFHTNTPFCAHSHTEFLVTNYSFVICFSLQPWFFFLLPLHSFTKSNFVFLSGQTNHKNPIISISLSTSIPSLWTFHRRYHFFPPLEVTLFSFSSIHQPNITRYGGKLSLMHESSICPVCILPSNREGAHGFHFHGYSKKFKIISLI